MKNYNKKCKAKYSHLVFFRRKDLREQLCVDIGAITLKMFGFVSMVM
jgi:hypothetical protein